VWLAGDSTMANPSSRCPVGWGSQFDALFNSEVVVKNRAVGGRSIQTWLYESNVSNTKGSDGECRLRSDAYSSRRQSMLNATTGMKPGDHLFIQFGINDTASACPQHVGRPRFQVMTMIAQAALARGAHVILLTSVAAITCSGGTATKNRAFVPQTFAAGTATEAPVVDLKTLSVSLYNSLRSARTTVTTDQARWARSSATTTPTSKPTARSVWPALSPTTHAARTSRSPHTSGSHALTAAAPTEPDRTPDVPAPADQLPAARATLARSAGWKDPMCLLHPPLQVPGGSPAEPCSQFAPHPPIPWSGEPESARSLSC
jgi:hypothetical protein